MIALSVTILWAGAGLGDSTPQQRCNAARLTAWISYLSCIGSAVAKEVGGGDFEAFAQCRHTYFSQWAAFRATDGLAGSTCVGARFTDNGVTVTDNLTGLVWEKKTTDGGVHDGHNLYTWSSGSSFAEDGTVFSGFLRTVNDAGFAGSSGWRLPTLAELQTVMLDFTCPSAGPDPCHCPSAPCIDPALDATSTQPGLYWTATNDVGDPSIARHVYFGNAFEYKVPHKTGQNYVRAVRGGL